MSLRGIRVASLKLKLRKDRTHLRDEPGVTRLLHLTKRIRKQGYGSIKLAFFRQLPSQSGTKRTRRHEFIDPPASFYLRRKNVSPPRQPAKCTLRFELDAGGEAFCSGRRRLGKDLICVLEAKRVLTDFVVQDGSRTNPVMPDRLVSDQFASFERSIQIAKPGAKIATDRCKIRNQTACTELQFRVVDLFVEVDSLDNTFRNSILINRSMECLKVSKP